MFLLRRPPFERVAAFRTAQGDLPFSYRQVGSTRGALPPGMRRDHHRVVLGTGNATWERARAAVRAWRMFELGWVELVEPSAPIATGSTVAVLVRTAGLWSLNAARVAWTVDETDRFGFAYATLPDHVECGEESFLVVRDERGGVAYELTADSRPAHPLARLGFAWTRSLQKRFARHSLEAMRRAVAESSPGGAG